MRMISTKLIWSTVLALGATITFAQVDTEESDSTILDADTEITLGETVIVGKGIIDLEEDRKTPVAVSTITKQEIQDKAVGNVEFPEIMKNTPSVYVANQAGGFGDSQMFVRGFDQSNTAFLLNGQPINGMEDGNMYWSNWSSMTDVANAVQVQRGLGSSKLAISSVGGTVNIVTKATEKKQGGMARFVMGNDSYMKGTIAYDTGLQNKWGVSVLLDYWTAHRKYARGTAGEGQSYFLSVGFKPNDHHNFNFMIFGAPQAHDQNFSKSLTTRYNNDGSIRTPGYDITGEKGNSNYGFLNGEALSTRRNYYHKPVANLNWDWNINSQASLSTVAYASVGRGGGTGPLGNGAGYVSDSYNSDGSINWNAFTDYNTTIASGIGGGYNGSALRASVNNHFWYGAVSNFNYELSDNWAFNVGADVRFYKGDHFRQLVNLLGLKGWDGSNNVRGEDYTVTEVFEANPWKALSNFADESQRIAYDYSETINYQGGFGQIEYANDWFSAFVQGAVSNQSYQREDRWNNPRTVEVDTDNDGTTDLYEVYPKESKKVSKIGYNIKGGLAFNLNKENTVFANAGQYSRQPYSDNVFQGSNPRGFSDNTYLRDPEVENEEITGLEFGYRYKSRMLNVNVNMYYTKWANRFVSFNSRNYEASNGTTYDEVSFLLTNVTQVHKGIEVDFNAKVSRKFTVRGYTSLGSWRYDGTSPYDVRDLEDFSILESESGEVDLKERFIGNAPQFSSGMGVQFEVAKGLSFDADLNYYARLFGQMEIGNINAVEQSERLAPYVVMDSGVSYEFKFSGKKIRFRGNVKNLFNTSYIGRKDGFGYFYGLGRTYNAGLQFNF